MPTVKSSLPAKLRPLLAVVGLIVLLYLTAFSWTASAPQPLLRVATNVWPGYEALYLARSLGLFGSAPIRLVEMTSASQVSHALQNGAVEAAALTLDEAVAVMQQNGVELRVVLVLDASNGADALLARNGIDAVAGLQGKRIGVENTATGAVLLDAALQSAGLDISQVGIVPMTVNDHLAAWQQGDIDAVVTFEPFRSRLLAAGACELFSSRQIPGRILDVLVVRADALAAHRQALRSLVRAHFAALDYFFANPGDAAQRMAPRLGVAAAQVLPLFAGLTLPDRVANRQWLAGDKPELQPVAADLAQLMLQRRLIGDPVDVANIAAAEFVTEPQP
ncbi:ABC transporter substrate-binding protein [Methylomonas sp. SURF-1]|uniref:ABC transporter substrate-binding protein n=1 Tax=Methylomonas aurea TaxID=2952224 RepID=A0ABT1UJ41_9GAMM|nr:ABC transporter substrate-binding protein [Methylomonas sp. SURF-1]MCQ8181685.1 ABC transporter substrate-binding protein [Methylomonas sp. SURF-1]